MNDMNKQNKRTAPSVKEVGCKSMLAENSALKVALKELIVFSPHSDAVVSAKRMRYIEAKCGARNTLRKFI